jgi:transcriptional regulator with XRE-family HTH domain
MNPKAKNLTGQKIRFFRNQRGWTQEALAESLQKMGIPITRHIIANIETQRSSVTDCQIGGFERGHRRLQFAHQQTA